jgi:hypothetical protein
MFDGYDYTSTVEKSAYSDAVSTSRCLVRNAHIRRYAGKDLLRARRVKALELRKETRLETPMVGQ